MKTYGTPLLAAFEGDFKKLETMSQQEKIMNQSQVHKLFLYNPTTGKLTQNLPHGNVMNMENETRISMNCRFKSYFSPFGDKKLGEFVLKVADKITNSLVEFIYTKARTQKWYFVRRLTCLSS